MVPHNRRTGPILREKKPLEKVDLIDDPDSPRAGRHRELEKAEVRKGEAAVQRVLTPIRSFTNPFTMMTTKNSFASSYCEYGVANRQLQD